MASAGPSRQNNNDTREGVCSIDIESITGSLKELCYTIQELVRVPSDVVLHRTKCCILAKSYAFGLDAVIERVNDFFDPRSRADYCRTLIPSLEELFHVMAQGKRFIVNCLQGYDWVEKTVVLALSTEAVDVCLREFICCICFIYQAVEQALTSSESRFPADRERKHDIYTRLNTLWADASDEQDLAILLDALNQKVAENESLDVPEHRLAKFMLHKLSIGKYLEHGRADERLPGCLWVDFSEFQIMGSIGGGAFAAVFKVQWWGKTFGLKEFLAVDNKDPFSRESAIHARLRHPNVVQLICCTENPLQDRCGLVMELMDLDLHSLMNQQMKDGRETPFSLDTAVDIMFQIAKGMEYLHRHGIMHRDLKSLNVLVSKLNPFDSRLRAKVADFGMAKAKYWGARFTTLQAGTTFWRAPEVFETTSEDDLEDQSNSKYTMKADVYSFAMVCYEILTGKFPFDDGGRRSELHQRLRRGVRPKLPSSCPAYLASYIEFCWHGDPSKRPSFTHISRTMRELKGILLTSANPLLSLCRFCSLIEEEVDSEIIGRDLLRLSKEVTLGSMAVLLEKPLYRTLMERKTLHQVPDEMPSMTESRKSFRELAHEIPPRPESRGSFINWTRKLLRRKKPSVEEVKSAKVRLLAELGYALRSFTSEELNAATYGFRERIGSSDRSWHSVLFRGTLADGQEVAVEVITDSKRAIESVVAEVRILGAVRHANIVPLLGWCVEKERVILVYEYMARGDLESNLFEQKHPMLSWPQRYKIVSGVASALQYLHCACKPQVLHRDPTPCNVMLDEDCNARLGGFDLAVHMSPESHDEMLPLGGTPGFFAPEIICTGMVSPATDVFAFGVLALVVACGRKWMEVENEEPILLLSMVMELYKAGTLLHAADKSLSLAGDLEKKQMECVLQLGLACTREDPSVRPSMAVVGMILSGEIPPPANVEQFDCPPYHMSSDSD